MTKLFNICAKRTYKDRQTGDEKTQWPQVGTLRVMDDGRQFIDLPLIGSFYVFEVKARNEAVAAAKAAGTSSGEFQDDPEIPF